MADKKEDQLSQLLVDTITKVEGGIEKGIDFAQAQIPDVIHQLLVWNFAVSLICWFLGLFGLGFGIFCVRQLLVHGEQWDDDQRVGRIAFHIIASLCGVVFGGVAVCVNLDWLQIWLAPKVWMIEYVSHLVRH